MFHVKHASQDLTKCEEIMRRVYDENPSFWPNGLSRAHFDGGLWLVEKTATAEPVGFTGWQVRWENGQKVGYYSVGILPEYRQHGMAKRAVSSMLAKQAHFVDVVKALIDQRNTPSIALANSLHPDAPFEVELVKNARVSPETLKGLAKAIGIYGGSGYGAMSFWDQYNHPDKPVSDSLQPWNWDRQRLSMGLLNAGLGMGGTGLITHGVKGMMHGGEAASHAPSQIAGGAGTIALSPAKDLIMKTIPAVDHANNYFDAQANKANQPDKPGMSPKALGLAGLAGLAGLGGLAYAGIRGSRALQEVADSHGEGRVHVKLPGRGPGETETSVEMPLRDVNFSDKLYHDLGRDTRRSVREGSNIRKRRWQAAHPHEDDGEPKNPNPFLIEHHE